MGMETDIAFCRAGLALYSTVCSRSRRRRGTRCRHRVTPATETSPRDLRAGTKWQDDLGPNFTRRFRSWSEYYLKSKGRCYRLPILPGSYFVWFSRILPPFSTPEDVNNV